MTGFDPTAPERDPDDDKPDEYPGNVVPPDALTDENVPPRGSAAADEAGSDDDPA